MFKIIISLFFITNLFGLDIKFNGYISKVTFNDKYLVAGLENGEIDIKNFNDYKLIDKIVLPKIEDFMGDKIPMPIYSLDILDNKLLILTQAENNIRKLFIYDIITKNLKLIFSLEKSFMKAKFIDKTHILFGLLSDEISLYDLKNNSFIYTKQIGEYVFSTFALNESKTKVAIGDESGEIKIVDVKSGKIIRKFNQFNKDQTISLDFKHNLVINGTTDKRVSIIDINGRYIIKQQVKFLPYGVALNEDNSFAVQYDENNNIAIFDMNQNLKKLIKGQTMPLNEMKFISKDKLISISADKIMITNIKGE